MDRKFVATNLPKEDQNFLRAAEAYVSANVGAEVILVAYTPKPQPVDGKIVQE